MTFDLRTKHKEIAMEALIACMGNDYLVTAYMEHDGTYQIHGYKPNERKSELQAERGADGKHK